MRKERLEIKEGRRGKGKRRKKRFIEWQYGDGENIERRRMEEKLHSMEGKADMKVRR